MNAVVGLWHAHVAWMMRDRVTNCTLFARDVLLEPSLKRIHELYIPLVLAGLLIPTLLGGLIAGSFMGALQGFLWGGLLRMFLVHQASWANASFGHRFGARPFETGDHSANNYWLALPTYGASYQNNHHAFPSSAYLGFGWRQVDVGALCIRMLSALHLVTEINGPPTVAMKEQRRIASRTADAPEASLPAQPSV